MHRPPPIANYGRRIKHDRTCTMDRLFASVLPISRAAAALKDKLASVRSKNLDNLGNYHHLLAHASPTCGRLYRRRHFFKMLHTSSTTVQRCITLSDSHLTWRIRRHHRDGKTRQCIPRSPNCTSRSLRSFGLSSS